MTNRNRSVRLQACRLCAPPAVAKAIGGRRWERPSEAFGPASPRNPLGLAQGAAHHAALHTSHSSWTPVLDGCNYWLDQATCLTYENKYDRKEWPQQEESNAYWRAVSPMSALQGYNLACCGNAGSRYHSSCVPERPCRKVLAITVNHGGAGS